MKITQFLDDTINGRLTLEEQSAFLQTKEDMDASEIEEAVRFLQDQRPVSFTLEDAIDVCGTGGSGLSRINTSTISTFILSALDVPIAKHGNKAASGRFGSFDLLESLGIRFSDKKTDIESVFYDTHLAFLFARFFHPVMKHFAGVRQQIGKPTFFNILGPLLSPADVQKQIIGTAFKDKMDLIAEVCRRLGKERVFVVRGEDGLDEVSLTGPTKVVELHHGEIQHYFISPEDFGILPATFNEIEGGDEAFNTQITLDILKGKCPSRHVDLVLINAALALYLVNKASSLKQGYQLAKTTLDNGSAYSLFTRMKKLTHTPSILLEIIANKRKEVATRKESFSLDQLKKEISHAKRQFLEAINNKPLSLIAEIKKASPSAGVISAESFDPVNIAQCYEKNGASAISVLTDTKYFQGSLNDLYDVATHTRNIPLLCKDFIIDKYQIYEARKHGADAILLIAAILNEKQIDSFLSIAKSLNMDAVCEVHTAQELDMVLKTSASIIGINNRNLHTFITDLKTTTLLAREIPEDKVIVSESGIHSKEDVEVLPSNVDAILVGTGLMRSDDIKETIQALIG